ncbi:hypothetical protein [Syntrophobacter fumaroxidans]|nr:hypothetical protein [Syntrophobacter fumaroxidans]
MMIRHLLHSFLSILIACSLALAGETPEKPAAWGTSKRDGVYWLVTPDGAPFYSKGVNIVTGGKDSEKSRLRQAYCWNNFFSSLEDWRKCTGDQLDALGFNTRGGWSDSSPQLDLMLTVDLELGRNSKFHWFDPFDPAMEQITADKAVELTAPFRNDPRLIGYYSDNEVGWWNSPLFEWYLKADWHNRTKRVLWQLLAERYRNDWTLLLEDWVPAEGINGFEDLKQRGAALKLRPGGHGIRVVNRFMYLVAKRYYHLMVQAIRKAHPGALVLGDRLPLYYHQDALLAIGNNVDVISTNYNVDTPDGWVAPYYFEGMQRLNDKPVLVTEFFFAAHENRSGNRNETARNKYAKPGHLMTVTTQAERAWGAGNAMLNFARFPNVVGAHWFQYCDEPLGGREDGEDYNMGLIDTANRPYEEVTEAFRKLNPVLETIHKWSRTAVVQLPPDDDNEGTGKRAVPIFRASTPIDVTDQSLVEWDKERSRVTGFRAPEPYVPFGDVHLAWRPEGLYLASLANTFVDPAFLAYTGEFPRCEAFRIDLKSTVQGETRRFAVYLVPADNPDFPDGFEIRPLLFQSLDGKPPERVPTAGRVQRLDKSLPHMAVEAFIPSELLGVPELREGMELDMNVTLVSYYREFVMTWAGKPDAEGTVSPEGVRKVVLAR